MPEASILEETCPQQTIMPLSLALKRPAEAELDLAPPSPDSSIIVQKSPVKLLNTVTVNRFKKRREDSLGGSDPGSSPPRDDSETDDRSLNGDMPAANEPRPFPCVWINGSSGIPITAEPEHPEEKPSPPPNPVTNGNTILTNGLTPPHLGNPLENLVKNHLAAVTGSPVHEGSMSPSQMGPDAESPLEVCPECHKVFKRKVYLQRHMEREHWSTAKVFKCDDCSYETKHQSNLSVHRRIHTGERPYHCGMCGQRYTQGHLLKSHIRSRHGGNMEYYNLEKKSDSTRGRKSLDAKHDHSSPATKQEKINSLVAQLEQQKMSQMMSSPMSQFMSNMSYINSLRPLMASPLALTGNLMAGPRLFTVGGLQNGLGNGLLQSPSLMMGGHPPPLSQVNSAVSQAAEMAAGIKIPVKVPDMSPNGTHLPGGLPGGHPSPPHQPAAPQQAAITPLHEAEDLSTTPQDLSTPQDLTTRRPSSRELLQNGDSHKDPEVPPESPVEGADTHRVINYVEPKVRHGSFTINGRGVKRSCSDLETDCTHAKKLRDLRRNIVRMLSVLTPDLSIENGLNYNSDQVDELLHEVIYSNMDDAEEYARKT